MTEVFIISWFMSGIVGCALMHGICLAHANDPELDKYGPGGEIYVLGGPIMLVMAVLVSITYALDKDED